MPARLTLYGRPGCHLCERMLTELQGLRGEFEFNVAEVDVDGELVLHLRYGEHVPVLVAGDRELSRHFLDVAMVRDYLGNFR